MRVKTNDLEARLESLTDDELQKMVGPAAQDYSPEALQVARGVIQQREARECKSSAESGQAGKTPELEERILPATRISGPFRRQKWEICLGETAAEFRCPRTGESQKVNRDSARQSLALASVEMSGHNLVFQAQGKKTKLILNPADLSELLEWLPVGETATLNEAFESSPRMMFGRIFRTVLLGYFGFAAATALVVSGRRGISFGEAFNQTFTNAYFQVTALSLAVILFLVYKWRK